MISRRTSFRIQSESSPQNCPTKSGPVLGVPESPKILYAPAVGKNPVGLCVPLFGLAQQRYTKHQRLLAICRTDNPLPPASLQASSRPSRISGRLTRGSHDGPLAHT